MCGIMFVTRKDGKPAAAQTIKRYHKQKTRGREGFGYVAIAASGKISHKRFQFEEDMLQNVAKLQEPSILLHHRYPTSVLNLAETAHPIRVSHFSLKYDYYVTHNGWITNAEELREKHIADGFKYTTEVQTSYKAGKVEYDGGIEFNDSEAFAIELVRAIEGHKSTIDTAINSPIAHITLQVDKRTGKAKAIYYGTNGGNDLTMTQDPHSMVLASEGGKYLDDNKTMRLELITGMVSEVPTIKLTPYTVYKPVASGYKYPTTYNDYKGGAKPSSSLFQEYEEELEMIDEQIIGLRAEIDYYAATGDEDAEARTKTEYKQLLDEREKLEGNALKNLI